MPALRCPLTLGKSPLDTDTDVRLGSPEEAGLKGDRLDSIPSQMTLGPGSHGGMWGAAYLAPYSRQPGNHYYS